MDRTFSSLGLEWKFTLPDTEEAYNGLAKRPHACLEAALKYTVFHDTLGDVRDTFTEVLDAHLKEQGVTVPWESGKKDANGEEEFLNPQEWFKKACAVTNKKPADYSFLQEKVYAKVQFDPSVRERKPPVPRKIPAPALDSAQALLDLHGKEVRREGLPTITVNVNEVAAAMAAKNPKAEAVVINPATNLPTKESLAKLIHANELRKRAEVNLTQQVLAEI